MERKSVGTVNDMLDVGERPALIVVDMQNAFCEADGYIARVGLEWRPLREAVPAMLELVEAARAAQIPIAYTRFTFEADFSDAGPVMLEQHPELRATGGLVRGTWDNALIDELQPRDGELVVDKTRNSAFFATSLEQWLRAREVDTVIVGGLTTNMCVESTCRDGFSLGFRTILAADASASVPREAHAAALANIEYGFGRAAGNEQIFAALRTFAARQHHPLEKGVSDD